MARRHVFRLVWTRTDTGATGIFEEVYYTENEARVWAKEWTTTLRNLDPKGEAPIVVRVAKEGPFVTALAGVS